MPFLSIKGRFHCTNYSPDGDTIRFEPTNASDLDLLEGVPARVNHRGHASIRIEGIDALETHYNNRHQPLELANKATDRLLEFLDIGNVVWDRNRSTVTASDDNVEGYIFARGTDKFGRIIAFVFTGESEFDSGNSVFVRPEMIEASANLMLLREGLAYPTYYWSLFSDLRNHMTSITLEAAQNNLGLHAVDQTVSGFTINNMGDLTDHHVIMPKLFRRLSDYVENANTVSGFKAALELSEEPVLDLRDSNFTHFDTFVEEDGNMIKLLRSPAELVFDPMPERPGSEFAMMMREAGPLDIG